MSRASQPHTSPLLGSLALGALLATMSLAGCGSGAGARSSTPGAGGRSPTATRVASATVSTTLTGSGPGIQAVAWVSQPATGKPEIWASFTGSSPRRIAQASGDDCTTSTLGPPVVSPDGQHIAVVGGAGCGDGQEHGSVFVVTVATGAFDPVPNSNALTNARSVGWLNNTTLWISGNSTYTLGASSVQGLPGVTSSVEAAVRGDTLFYLAPDYGNLTTLSATLHRYSLSAHHDLNTIDLGSFQLPTGRSPGDFHFQGWDASPDGTHVVYQVTTPATPSDTQPEGIASSRIEYANADGSGATQILQYMATTNTVRMRFSPDGTQVAVTEAEPAPDIITGCVASPGAHADPCFHSYVLPAGQFSANYPAWAADGRTFLAEGSGNLYRYSVGTSTGSLAQPNASNPWSV